MNFEVPALPYEKSALSPHISEQTVELHYEKHHKGYMTKLEKALSGTIDEDKELEDIVRAAEGDLFNNAAQVWNHNFYWLSLDPQGGGDPGDMLGSALARDFGSVTRFKEEFASAAKSQFGSGWAWLVVNDAGRLIVRSSSDADNPLRSQQIPLLTLDVWEHAYYVDYYNERGAYVEAFLEHLVNWGFAQQNFLALEQAA